MLSLSSLLFSDAFFWMLRVSPVTGSFPQPLSAAREQEALEALQQGDADAKNLLIEHNLRLVAHVVKKYYASREDQDDLVSIGTIGLIKAVSTFKPDKNIRLATYACRCIENPILSPTNLSVPLSQTIPLGMNFQCLRRTSAYPVERVLMGFPFLLSIFISFDLSLLGSFWKPNSFAKNIATIVISP